MALNIVLRPSLRKSGAFVSNLVWIEVSERRPMSATMRLRRLSLLTLVTARGLVPAVILALDAPA